MTIIDELEGMDFVNWDAAGDDTGFDFLPSEGAPSGHVDETQMDLVLGDVEGDDWSFWALQHYESTQVPQDFTMPTFTEPTSAMPEPLLAQMYWENPEAPCLHCATGGYQCKKIQEGKYKGYCTSCVALRCECSFGPSGNHAGSEGGETFPANPWPIMGDRPETSILHEDDLTAALNPILTAPNFNPRAIGAEVNLTSPTEMPKTGAEANIPSPTGMPKIGARFSRESVRVLKNWVSTHSRHPYPTEEEKESLQKITGLNKTQIVNWLANARRRGKIQPTRSTSPHVGGGYAQAIDIPQRKGTPGLFENMNPLQRWQNSPPENEPASVTAIARAVASNSTVSSSSDLNSLYVSGYSDDGSSRSLCNLSSISSFSNSRGSSAGSFGSSFSRQSRGSHSSLPSFARSNRGRRRRRRAPPKRAEEGLQQPLKTFQCTFCTETFRTKHDWQRHEKSLHLSLERWICSPDGHKALNPETGLVSCVFCGEANPDEPHLESHGFSQCRERTLEERTFYRKDHLRQHLKLVHNSKFLQWSMDKWRISTPAIRSRCGFCGIVMDSWTFRVDHLAEHFKTGNTMKDWKGDWGFEAPVLNMVENSIPPYLIHDERNTPLPYIACQSSPASPNNAYDLLKSELQYWAQNWTADTGNPPKDDDIQREACRVIFGAEARCSIPVQQSTSWLRDLILSREDLTKAATYQPIRQSMEDRMSDLRINGKEDIFDDCEIESQLQDFVKARTLLGLTAMDPELQVEACKIIGRAEEKSNNPSEDVANWLLRLIHSSPAWLSAFRKRAHLPDSGDIVVDNKRSKDPMLIDSTIHNYSRLDRELGEFLQVQRSMGLEPTDSDLQLQARLIIYDNDDDWNQTAADDVEWLGNFKHRHPPQEANVMAATTNSSPASYQPTLFQPPVLPGSSGSSYAGALARGKSGPSMKPGPFFLRDANSYNRLAKALGRFVASTTSVNNPNRHIPTDEELQHQARWILYDDDDPWNQTAADNAEWLLRFKRDAGILPADSGPGLGIELPAWSLPSGGTGFAPPYVSPNPQATIEPITDNSNIFFQDDTRPLETDAATVNHYLQSFKKRYPAPAKVFCSRELENGLKEYVKRQVNKNNTFPTDDQLRERATEIMGMQKTPADDPVLLEKFKAVMQGDGFPITSTAAAGSATVASALLAGPGFTTGLGSISLLDQPGAFISGEDMGMTDQEVNTILQNINDELDDGSRLDLGMPGQGSGAGLGL